MLRFAKRAFRWILWRTFQRSRILFFRLISNARFVDGEPIRYQPVHLAGAGRIVFGSEVKLGVAQSPGFFSTCAYLEARGPTAEIVIGAHSWINNGFSAIAEAGRISLGENCLIGHDVTVYDSDFHPLDPRARLGSAQLPKRADVTIGNNVFIGSRSMILKGSQIGHGCVVAAGSVVSGDFPAATLVAGNPARVVRSL